MAESMELNGSFPRAPLENPATPWSTASRSAMLNFAFR